jgi:hypothetical protein
MLIALSGQVRMHSRRTPKVALIGSDLRGQTEHA